MMLALFLLSASLSACLIASSGPDSRLKTQRAKYCEWRPDASPVLSLFFTLTLCGRIITTTTMNTLDLNKSLEYAQEKLKELRDTVTSNPAYVAAAEKATAHIATARAAVAAGTKDVSSHVQNASLALSSFTSDTSAALSAKATEAFASAKEALVAASNAVAQFADQAVKRALRAVSDLDQKYQVQDRPPAGPQLTQSSTSSPTQRRSMRVRYCLRPPLRPAKSGTLSLGSRDAGGQYIERRPTPRALSCRTYGGQAGLCGSCPCVKKVSHMHSWRPHRGVLGHP